MDRFTFPIYASRAAVHASRRLLAAAGFPTEARMSDRVTCTALDDEGLGHVPHIMAAIDQSIFALGPHAKGPKFDAVLVALVRSCIKDVEMDMWEALLRLHPGLPTDAYRQLIDELHAKLSDADLHAAGELVEASREVLEKFDSPRRRM